MIVSQLIYPVPCSWVLEFFSIFLLFQITQIFYTHFSSVCKNIYKINSRKWDFWVKSKRFCNFYRCFQISPSKGCLISHSYQQSMCHQILPGKWLSIIQDFVNQMDEKQHFSVVLHCIYHWEIFFLWLSTIWVSFSLNHLFFAIFIGLLDYFLTYF